VSKRKELVCGIRRGKEAPDWLEGKEKN